jgi:beta-lactamase class A
MQASATGKNRLRAGLPRNWLVGDKTGTGNRGACNDVAIALRPGRPPVVIAVYMSDGSSEIAALEAAHAEVARIVATELGA